MKKFTVAEAKATFSARLREAENGNSVVITRHGKPVVALVPVDDVEKLARLRASGPDGGLASLAGGWEGSDELVRSLTESTRISRTIPPLD